MADLTSKFLCLRPVSSYILCLAGRRDWMFSEHLRRICYQPLGLLRTYEATSWTAANHIQIPLLSSYPLKWDPRFFSKI